MDLIERLISFIDSLNEDNYEDEFYSLTFSQLEECFKLGKTYYKLNPDIFKEADSLYLFEEIADAYKNRIDFILFLDDAELIIKWYNYCEEHK